MANVKPVALGKYAIRLSLEEITNLFVDVYASLLHSLTTMSAAACVLDELFIMSEVRAALRLMRRQNASGPDRMPSQALLNFPDQALVKLLNWYNEVWKADCVPPE